MQTATFFVVFVCILTVASLIFRFRLLFNEISRGITSFDVRLVSVNTNGTNINVFNVSNGNISKHSNIQNKIIPDALSVADYLNCRNQTKCIQPVLQLRKELRVYYCKHINYGIRFYYLVKEGLLLHPKIILVDHISQADFIVYLPESSNWQKSECNRPQHLSKIIALDEGDFPNLFLPDKGRFLMTFKRSYVKRIDGKFKHFMPYISQPNVFPMTYIVAEIYVRTIFKLYHERPLNILCSLRALPSDPTRSRVKTWVDEYVRVKNVANSYTGEVNSASRPTVSKQYFERMYSSKIIITSNPSDWEGDFRLCEALATGALVFVDEMYVPRPHPFQHLKHLVIYNNHNKSDLFQKLDYFLQHHEEAKRIAFQGYLHAMRYHRAANLIDYVFRTLHSWLLSRSENTTQPLLTNPLFASSYKHYSETGFALRLLAIQQQQEGKSR